MAPASLSNQWAHECGACEWLGQKIRYAQVPARIFLAQENPHVPVGSLSPPDAGN